MSIKKSLLSITLACAMMFSLAACGGTAASTPAAGQESKPASTGEASTPAAEDSTAADTGEKPYIAIISKGFQHQFWQVVNKGAEAAAKDLGVEISFDGPPNESDIQIQVDMLKSAMDKKPAAICLAALDTESVMEQLNTLKSNGIPVVGFDSGVPNAPEGSIYATASTDNAAAAAIAADHLFANEDFKAKLDAATTDKPVHVGIISQDATSESVINRTIGFIDKMVELVGEGDVEITGHDKYKKAAANGAKLVITVSVPATTDAADMKTAAETMLTSGNLTAIYGSNEGAVNGVLSASNDGNDFNKENGKYKDIIAIGFDAGKTQRVAVENGWFYGSITQDPYQIGYMAVSLAKDAIDGKAAASPVVDTGAKWYDASNLSDPAISDLVYE